MPNYDNYNYNTMGFGDDPLHQSQDSEMPKGLIGMVDDMVGGLFFGDPDASSSIFGELTGYNKQQREFAQQEYMQDKTWEHDSAAAQMARARAAGINLNTAAAGIAGAGTSSPVSVPSGGSSPAAAADSVSGFVNAMSNSRLNAASANEAQALADKTNAEVPWIPKLSQGKILNMFSDFTKGLTDSGIEEISAGSLAFDLMSGGLTSAVKYLSLVSDIRNNKLKMDNINADYQLKLKDIDSYKLRLDSSLSLQEKQGLQAAAQAAKLEADKTYQDQINALNSELPGITLGAAALPISLAWKFGVDSPQFKALEDGLYRWNYFSAFGGFSADVDTAYDRYYNQTKGTKDVSVEYDEYESFIRQNEEFVKSYIKLLFDNPGKSDLIGMVNRLTSAINLANLQDYISPNDLVRGASPAARQKVKPAKGGLPHYRDMSR